MPRTIIVLFAMFAFLTPAVASAQSATAAVTGTVHNAQGAPVAGVRIVLSGPSQATVYSDATGAFTATIQQGIYRVAASKGGYVPASLNDLTVLAGQNAPLDIVMSQADLSSLKTIASVTSLGRGSSINTTAGSISELSGVDIKNLANPQVNDVLQRLPDVVIEKMGSQPDTTIVLGGVQPYETQVLIDGHPLSMGGYGVWLSEYFSSFLLSGVETQVGPGNTTPFANTAVGGTANLLTPSFTLKQKTDLVVGTDSYGSQYSNVLTSGKWGNRVSYVAGLGYGSSNGPYFQGNHCVVNPDPASPPALNEPSGVNEPGSLGTIQFCGDSSGSLFTKGEILKLKYDFSSATSWEMGFIGSQGGYLPQGTSYGQSLGQTTIEECSTANYYLCTNPKYQNYVGQTINGYSWYPGSNVYTNQPIFTGQLRTSLGNDTILIRPYAGNVERIVDGQGEDQYPENFSPPFGYQGYEPPSSNPSGTAQNTFEADCYGSEIGQITGYNKTPTVTSTGQEECYQTQFSEFEQDKLYGTTFSYLHPFGDNLVNLTYDYHGDNTYGYYNANTPADVTVPDTTERYSTLSLTGDLRTVRNVSAKVGLYATTWNLAGQQSVPSATPEPDGAIPTEGLTRSVSRFDPHIGFAFQPTNRISYRAAFGTSETFPFSGQVSGSPFYTQPSGTTGTTFPNGFVTDKNPFLNPETSAEFSAGMDMRMHGGALFSVNLQDTQIRNVFETLVTPCAVNVGLADTGTCGGLAALDSPVNAAKLSVQMASLRYAYNPKVGLGYNASVGIERSIISGIPASFYIAGPSLPANGQQTCGYGNAVPGSTTCIPYLKGYGQLTYTFADGTYMGLGADFQGKNNTYFQPPFWQYDLTIRRPIRKDLDFQVSVQNLLNTNNFCNLPQPNSGVTTSAGEAGGALTSIPSILIPAPPRTVRVQLHWHIGQ